MKKLKLIIEDYKYLLRSVPGIVTTFFCISVVVMNLMANKVILNSKFVALDGGLILSWIPFLCMDVITKKYGPKAATKMNIFALLVNLIFVLVFALVASLQIEIGNDYKQGDVFAAFDSVFTSTWFVLLASSIAFLSSGIINNSLNWSIGKLFKKNPNGKASFYTSSYISTFLGQFADNLLFAVLVFMVFAPIYWGYSLTILQCLGSAILGAIVELIVEIIFSPIGYKIYKKWQIEKIGDDYINYIGNRKLEVK